MRDAAATIERKILFHRIHTGLDANNKPIPFDVAKALTHVHALPWTAAGRYWESEDGNATACWLDPRKPLRVCLGTIRRSGLPRVEASGNLKALQIASGAGLAEQTHAVFFPSDRIVACEFNFYGPRMTRFSKYLLEKAKTLCPPGLGFEPLIRGDISEQLALMEDVRLLDLKVRASYTEQIAKYDENLAAALDGLAVFGDANEVEIVLRPKRKKALAQSVLKLLRRLVRQSTIHEEAATLKMRGLNGETGQVEQLDLLTDAFVSRKKIMRSEPSSRAVDSPSAFEAIEAAFKELRPDLLKAASAK
jgi:hypothetical protein